MNMNFKVIFLLLLINSCGYNPASSYKNPVVNEIIIRDNGCSYYGKTEDIQFLASPYFRIIDTCGKFNIGDTIKFVK